MQSLDAADLSTGMGAGYHRNVFTVACERGRDVKLSLMLDEAQRGVVATYALEEDMDSCKVK
jgi:hypothetical protein